MGQDAPNPFSRLYSWTVGRFVEWFMSSRPRKQIDKKTILVVDDKVELVDLIKFRLIEEGYSVATANNGVDGLAQLKKVTPDLIVLDVNMPEMNGLEFYKNITTQYGRSKFPVLFLTDKTELREIFDDIEVDGFLPKPFQVDELIKEVDRIITGYGINPYIFIVDNAENPQVQQIRNTFVDERYDVVIVDTFENLVSEALSKKPVCILLEYMQKDIAGDELIAKIKQDSTLKNVPVISYSFSGFSEYKQKSLEAGAFKYLDKPADSKVFLTIIREMELGRDKNWYDSKEKP